MPTASNDLQEEKMFEKNKGLIVFAFAILFFACDLEANNPGGDGTIPTPPTNIRAVAVSPTSISVTWNKVSGATSYEVYFETGSTPLSRVNTVPGTSYTHTGLQPNTTYSYYITAKNNAGTSDYSSRASATTQSRN